MVLNLLVRTLAGVAVLSSNAVAQVSSAAADRPLLTLRGAIEEAREANPELIALQREYEAARAAPEAERFLMPPMVEVQIWGWPVTTLNPARTDMYMFMAEQQLPGRGKRAARIVVAEREAEVSRQQIAVRANQIATDVRAAYVDLAFTRETFAVYTRQTRLLDELAESATARYAAGEGPQHHTVVTVVELASVERDRIAAEERAQAAEARLNALLGRSIAQPVEALDPVLGTMTAGEAEQLALARHPEVGMVAAAVTREEAELSRLRGERRPDFVVGGGYMLQPGEAGAWTARAGVTWPNAPWSRGKLNADIEAQSRRVEAAKARGAVVATRLRQTIREAAVQISAAERQLHLIESTVMPHIEHAFELARVAFAAGESGFGEVLDARRTLLSTELQAAEARANLARARASLESIAGAL